MIVQQSDGSRHKASQGSVCSEWEGSESVAWGQGAVLTIKNVSDVLGYTVYVAFSHSSSFVCAGEWFLFKTNYFTAQLYYSVKWVPVDAGQCPKPDCDVESYYGLNETSVESCQNWWAWHAPQYAGYDLEIEASFVLYLFMQMSCYILYKVSVSWIRLWFSHSCQ